MHQPTSGACALPRRTTGAARSRRAAVAALSLALAPVAAACAPPATPPATPGEASTAAASSPGAAPAGSPVEASAAPAPAQPPGARVVAVEPSKESAPYARAKIELSNPGPMPCRFVSYTLSWGASTKEIKLEDVSIPAGQTRERWIKVHPADGDLGALKVESARVEATTECGG